MNSAASHGDGPTILLTGFGPFAKVERNPSEQIVAALGGSRVDGHDVVGRVLPVSAEHTPVAVRTALAETKPDNVSYLVLRLADDSFLHVSFHDHGDDEVNPIASLPAFAHFQDGHAERREGGVDQQTAQLVGAYVTMIA